MGFITSANTIYANAYLTEKGREYLFSGQRFDSSGDDLFQITSFILGDPDANYFVVDLDTDNILQTGTVPDVSGKNEDCIKGAQYKTQAVKVIFSGAVPSPSFNTTSTGISSNIAYQTDQNANILVFSYQD